MQRFHVTDLYPTFLELAAVPCPKVDGKRQSEPLYGNSLVPLLHNEELPHTAIHDEIFWCFNQTGNGFKKGDWKISSISVGPWRLTPSDSTRRNRMTATWLLVVFPSSLWASDSEWRSRH